MKKTAVILNYVRVILAIALISVFSYNMGMHSTKANLVDKVDKCVSTKNIMKKHQDWNKTFGHDYKVGNLYSHAEMLVSHEWYQCFIKELY